VLCNAVSLKGGDLATKFEVWYPNPKFREKSKKKYSIDSYSNSKKKKIIQPIKIILFTPFWGRFCRMLLPLGSSFFLFLDFIHPIQQH
jgi:hypothetical protein